MSYATRIDLEQKFGKDEIAGLASDPSDADADRTYRALEAARAQINAYLSVAYDLPLAGAYPLLGKLQCDLARGELYDEVESDEVRSRVKAAMKTLEELRDRKIRLLRSDGTVCPCRQAPRGHSTAGRTGPKPRITDSALEGY